MDDIFEITVALVGRPWDPNPDAIEEDCSRPYEDRLKVALRANSTDSLAHLLAMATDEFGDSHPGDYTSAGQSLAFYQGDPSEGVVLTIPALTTVTITDHNGLAVWHVRPDQASIGDLVIAADRKVFRGDPLRPYLVVDPKSGMGGPTPGGWDTIIQIWDVLVYIAGSTAVVKSGIDITRRGRELIGRVADSWKRHQRAALYTRKLFEDRGADIIDVIQTARAATTYQIADLMAWTGIDDPALAADVGGWAGYRLDEDSESLSPDPDEDYLALGVDLPINLSVDFIGSDRPDYEECVDAVKEALIDLGLALPDTDESEDPGS